MYRPNKARTPRRASKAVEAAKAVLGAVKYMSQAIFAAGGLFDEAIKENRRRDRITTRWRRHNSYAAVGLNGPRAVARRVRQIAVGQLRRENGLCVSQVAIAA